MKFVKYYFCDITSVRAENDHVNSEMVWKTKKIPFTTCLAVAQIFMFYTSRLKGFDFYSGAYIQLIHIEIDRELQTVYRGFHI
jgi:hypothetical protein